MYKHVICNIIYYLEPAISDIRNAKNYIIFATLKVKTIFLMHLFHYHQITNHE